MRIIKYLCVFFFVFLVCIHAIPYAFLSNQTDVSEEEMTRARAVRDNILTLIASRNEYIKENRIDPRFAFGDENWKNDGHHPMYTAFEMLKIADRETLNRMLLLTIVFPGGIENFRNAQEHENFIHNLRNAIYRNEYDHSLVERSRLSVCIEENLGYYNYEKWKEMIRNIPAKYLVRFPQKFGQVGMKYGDLIVNFDTCVYQSRINYLYESGILAKLEDIAKRKGVVRILEIGTGYGALAFVIKSLIPNAAYYLCDIPESLLFSGMYLSMVVPKEKLWFSLDEATQNEPSFHFVPNYQFDRISGEFDLVINTFSLGEMSLLQQEYYTRGISKLIGENGIFIEQNCGDKSSMIPHFSYRYTLAAAYGAAMGRVDVWTNSPRNFSP